jgi:hypothetical protein
MLLVKKNILNIAKERFVIRDIETGELFKKNYGNITDYKTKRVIRFRSIWAAKSFLLNLHYGLELYYEIYDESENKVVFSLEGGRRTNGKNKK